METDWFTLRDARLQLSPFTPGGIEIATASVYSPNGVTVAGEHGLSILSLAAGDDEGRSRLVANWRIYEETCAEHGFLPRRDNWRLVVAMHLADSAEQARREVRDGLLRLKRLWSDLGGRDDIAAWRDPDEAVDFWLANGLPAFGKPVLGTPDDAIAAIRGLQELTGGFGVLLLANHGFASWQATQASYELFAEFVAPHFQGSLANRFASLEWMTDNKERFVGERKGAIDAANAKRVPGAGATR
jgi:limonene 1,2-monooxygenase